MSIKSGQLRSIPMHLITIAFLFIDIYICSIFKLKSFKMNIRKTTSESFTCAFCKIYGDSPYFKSNDQFKRRGPRFITSYCLLALVCPYCLLML